MSTAATATTVRMRRPARPTEPRRVIFSRDIYGKHELMDHFRRPTDYDVAALVAQIGRDL